MKGTLQKTEQGWVVSYLSEYKQSHSSVNEWRYIPLHPDFIEMMDTCFTSKFTHEIEFEIVRYCKKHNSDPSKNSVCTLDCGYEEVSYAKLIHHPVDTNKMMDHTGEVNEMVNHVPDVGKMVEQIEKLAELNGSPDSSGFYDYKEGFVDGYLEGYNNPKETLYTEEQVREAIEMAREIKDSYFTEGYKRITKYTSFEIIQSLKQSKQ